MSNEVKAILEAIYGNQYTMIWDEGDPTMAIGILGSDIDTGDEGMYILSAYITYGEEDKKEGYWPMKVKITLEGRYIDSGDHRDEDDAFIMGVVAGRVDRFEKPGPKVESLAYAKDDAGKPQVCFWSREKSGREDNKD